MRICDRVLFLNNAAAEEIGTHAQLMESGKGYARMYAIQSHYYQSSAIDGMEAAR